MASRYNVGDVVVFAAANISHRENLARAVENVGFESGGKGVVKSIVTRQRVQVVDVNALEHVLHVRNVQLKVPVVDINLPQNAECKRKW